MIDFIYPLIKTVWKEEVIPQSWNVGNVTSIWKGRGDKENLNNQRGITTSSAIGTIMDSLIYNRLEFKIPFTQAQGGGKKGSSTCDHLFLLRAIFDIAKKQKRPVYMTFYDVSKAYDNVDNNDMLDITWNKGLRGKAWRILRNLNKNLKARINTRYGQTRTIDMHVGGKQGSRLTGRMFAKMMDMLQEEIVPSKEGLVLGEDLTIAFLLWVDDVVSFVEGEEEQENILKRINNFAIRHKLRWGAEKCKILKIGKHEERKNPKEWKLGEQIITEADNYRYLGDIISKDGKNEKNIEARKAKTVASVVTINTIAAYDTLRGIETAILLELHEKIIVSGLLSNAESWTLTRGNKDELDKVELQALKQLFDLPAHAPTPGIMYMLGTTYTRHRIDKKRLMYLHRVINNSNETWTKKTLMTLDNMNIGWSRSIRETLSEYGLPTNFDEIKIMTKRQWKRTVNANAEIMNKRRLLDECHKNENGKRTPKTKTKHIIKTIESDAYSRAPQQEIMNCTRQETKTIIIARFGMLECGTNFKGTLKEMCNMCNVTDDESHRINFCPKYKDFNRCDSDNKVDFNDIHSTDINILKQIINEIERVWNVRTAHGTANK